MRGQERQLVLESFFLSQNRNLKSPISADWQLWFPLGWQSGGGKPDQGGRVWERRRIRPLTGQTNHSPSTMLSAWCYCADQKWGFGSHCESLMQRYYLWPIMCRLAAEPDGSAATAEPDTSKPNLTVSQNWWLTIMEKQMWNSRCCPQISHRNAHLMRNGARL